MISIRIIFFAYFISGLTFCLFAQEIIVPVSEKNRFACSSFLKPSKVSSYGPENICDFDQSTAWVEGVKGDGVDEWVAIYLGSVEDLKDISELEITIYPGYQKNNDTFENNGCPTSLKFELNIIDQVVSSEIMFEPKDKYELRGARKITLNTKSNQLKHGSLWLKVTILKVQKGKKWDDTAISEIICNFKNANPFNIHSIINQFQNALNNKNESKIKLMSELHINKIYSAFTNQYEAELNPYCCLAKPEIHSFDTVILYATGGEVSNPLTSNPYVILENIYRIKGDYRSLLDILQLIVKLNPDDVIAKSNITKYQNILSEDDIQDIEDIETLRIIANKFNGSWKGRYLCTQGETILFLEICAKTSGKITANFTFYPLKSNLEAKIGLFTLEGKFMKDGSFVLGAKEWVRKPDNYEMVDIKGKIESNYVEINGVIIHPSCSTFKLIKIDSQ